MTAVTIRSRLDVTIELMQDMKILRDEKLNLLKKLLRERETLTAGQRRVIMDRIAELNDEIDSVAMALSY